MKFLTHTGIIALTVLLAVIAVYTSLIVIAVINLDIGDMADMGFVKYTKSSVSLGKLEIAGFVYNIDVFSVEEVVQSYKNALMKADLFTPETLKFVSFLK